MFYRRIFYFLLIVLVCGNGFFCIKNQSKAQANPKIIINELMWMGSHLSSSDEWIELRNFENQDLDLSNWYLTKKSSGQEVLMLKIPAGKTVKANSFFLISNFNNDSTSSVLQTPPDLVDSDISLVNSALQIKLYDALGNLIDTADDGSGAPLAGEYASGSIWQSMERNNNPTDGTLSTDWHTAQTSQGLDLNSLEMGTPGYPNSNTEPVVEAGGDQTVQIGQAINFDASETFDPDNDTLSYSWNFGDGGSGSGITPTHVYQIEGSYTVVLSVSDGQNNVSDSLVIKVEKIETITVTNTNNSTNNNQNINTNTAHPIQTTLNTNQSVNTQTSQEKIDYQFSDKILINEIFPNPVGLDQDNEFIELVNLDKKDINLIGWKIDDTKKSIVFKENKLIESQGFLVLKYKDTKLTLKNSGGILYLIDPNKKIISGVEYDRAKEGQSFSRVSEGNSWKWTTKVTPGEENEIMEEVVENVDATSQADLVESGLNTNTNKNEEKIIETSISQAKSLEKGTKVKVKGFVSVEPDVFGTQYFYIFDGSAGIKIYSSKKDFPKLKTEDYIEVTGQTSEAQNEKRINISSQNDIKNLGPGDFPQAKELSIDQVNEETVGALVKLSGEVLDKKASDIILGDKNSEIDIYFKDSANLKKPDLVPGDKISVLGIIIPQTDGFRILPRYNSDIEKLGQVLGKETENKVEIPSDDKIINLKKYLIIGLIGALIVSVGVGIRIYKKRKTLAK